MKSAAASCLGVLLGMTGWGAAARPARYRVEGPVSVVFLEAGSSTFFIQGLLFIPDELLLSVKTILARDNFS